MYLEHFNLNTLPFTLTPNTGFFCQLSTHQEALEVLLMGLSSGEGFIKITGEVGAGKTLLCRMLLEKLNEDYVTAYIPNPDLTPAGLRRALALELQVPTPLPVDQHRLLTVITERLIALHQEGKKVVLLIDEAQTLTFECLEAVRLLTNIETESSKLLQVVLFGQPELDEKINKPNLRQLKQRITFSYELKKLSRDELEPYLCYRLTMAGYTLGSPFTKRALNLLYRRSEGIPRLINVLSHKAMMIAYGKNEKRVDHKAVDLAAKDTDAVKMTFNKKHLLWLIPASSVCLFGLFLVVGR